MMIQATKFAFIAAFMLFSGNWRNAQEIDARQVFEVVSIKPSAPQPGHAAIPRISGGPGSRDPNRFTTENFSLYYLISSAFDLKRYQIAAPPWTETAFFDIAAKVGEGASKDQFRAMLRNMLAERFKLRSHFEKKKNKSTPLNSWRQAPGPNRR